MADEHLTMDRIIDAKQSVCCHAGVHTEDGGPDFIGAADPSACRTCWFVCDECGAACDLERAAG